VELRHLRYFVAVTERKGFREASRLLQVIQPAIGKTLTQLEQELGVELFVRSGRTVLACPVICTSGSETNRYGRSMEAVSMAYRVPMSVKSVGVQT